DGARKLIVAGGLRTSVGMWSTTRGRDGAASFGKANRAPLGEAFSRLDRGTDARARVAGLRERTLARRPRSELPAQTGRARGGGTDAAAWLCGWPRPAPLAEARVWRGAAARRGGTGPGAGTSTH